MRSYWQFRDYVFQLKLLLNWPRFCPERASQPGETLNVKLDAGYLLSSSSAL